MSFPLTRMQRLRSSSTLRDLVAETSLSLNDFVYPLFVIEGENIADPIPSMPGIKRFSLDKVIKECQSLVNIGIFSVILFGIPSKKDALGTQAYSSKGIISKAIKKIKKEIPLLTVICDVCLCEYTDHGHCGTLKDGKIDNDNTIKLLGKAALTYAQAGADIVAPSDMMDGRVLEIRKTLDKNSFHQIPIMSYAAKYASAFYGPFRDAAECAPSFGNRNNYQMDPRNAREAIQECKLDIFEGADIIMVKPALAYLDIISKVREKFNVPIAAFNVSGEYSMLKAAAAKGWVNYNLILLETLTSIKRAGADIIITYHAKEIATILK